MTIFAWLLLLVLATVFTAALLAEIFRPDRKPVWIYILSAAAGVSVMIVAVSFPYMLDSHAAGLATEQEELRATCEALLARPAPR